MGFTMPDEMFALYYGRHLNDIEAIARKIAKRDETLYDDLCQVGRIGLWRFNPAKVVDNEVSCIRNHLRFRMLDFIRQSKRKYVEALADYLAMGDQIVKGPDGQIELVQNKRRQLIDPDEFAEWPGNAQSQL